MALVIMITLIILTLIIVTPEGNTSKKIIASAITLVNMGALAWLMNH